MLVLLMLESYSSTLSAIQWHALHMKMPQLDQGTRRHTQLIKRALKEL
jgi:hypothetical protein